MTADHSWMRPVLTALFDDFSEEQIRTALASDAERADLRLKLNRLALLDGKLGVISDDSYGDNLLHGLLALRAKFDRETAIAKLEVNLAMRNRRKT